MLVRDVMTRSVVRAAPETPLAEAADTLVRRRLRAIPIVDDQEHVVGMLTDRQVMTHFLPGLEDPDAGRPDRPAVIRDGTVRDVMERTVMCVNENEPLGDVVRLMLDKEIERPPRRERQPTRRLSDAGGHHQAAPGRCPGCGRGRRYVRGDDR